MARRDDDDAPWTRQLLVGLVLLAVVALVIGAVMSVVALGAAKVAGIDQAGEGPSARPSLFFPTGEPNTGPEASAAGPDVPSTSASPAPTTSAPPPKPRKPTKSIALQAFPARVGANARINLTGVYQGGEGAQLQVQRFEGGWVDFPVTTSVSGGQFTTYIFSGREGRNRFRMIDKDSGRKSNAVRVTIG